MVRSDTAFIRVAGVEAHSRKKDPCVCVVCIDKSGRGYVH